jgi:hypothetical protein
VSEKDGSQLNIRVGDSLRLPAINAYVESETIDSGRISECDVIFPVYDGIGKCISDHVMCYDIFR